MLSDIFLRDFDSAQYQRCKPLPLWVASFRSGEVCLSIQSWSPHDIISEALFFSYEYHERNGSMCFIAAPDELGAFTEAMKERTHPSLAYIGRKEMEKKI